MKIEIGIATANRTELVGRTVEYILGSKTAEASIAVSIATPTDFARSDSHQDVKLLSSARGSSAQRNTILLSSNADIVVFLDDDFLPAADYIQQVAQLFQSNPDVVVATGMLIADGARTGGMEFEEGLMLLAATRPNVDGEPTETYGAYGCNMAVRMSSVRQNNIRFDENLPLYGWQEDIDFSRQLSSYGRVVRSPRLQGVHLGTKRSGRSPGRQLGYSQIANPYYLIKKGTMSRKFAWRLVRNNLSGNIIRFLRPEPTVDRRGRLWGNILAIRDIVVGKCNPARILDM